MSTRSGGADLPTSSELVVETPSWHDDTTLELSYTAGDEVFTETIEFPEPIVDSQRSGRLDDLLATAAGVSYSKAVGATRIMLGDGVALSPAGLAYANALHDDGMREFAITNGLPIPTGVRVDATPAQPMPPVVDGGSEFYPDAILIPFGAGRDSTMLAARLAELGPTLFKVGDDAYSPAVADALGLPLRVARRHISPRLIELNSLGAPNGHVPVTALNSLIAIIYADSRGYGRVAMANERASSSPTSIVNGHRVNHQYSKSAAAEDLLRAAVAEAGSSVDYFSALRSWTDDQIGTAFATLPADVQGAFMSCNRAFVRDPAHRSDGWCGRCAKCASTFLSLAPHLPPHRMKEIFGFDMLHTPELIEEFRNLVTESDKPFECVADVGEARYNLGLLTAQPEWADAPVVASLAADATPTPPDLAGVPGDDNNVPADIRAALSSVAAR